MPDFPVSDANHHHLHAVAVLRSEEVAAACQELAAIGVSGLDVQIGTHAPAVASMRAEMRAELEDSLISPTAAIAYTKESLKGMAVLMPVMSLVTTAAAVSLMFAS